MKLRWVQKVSTGFCEGDGKACKRLAIGAWANGDNKLVMLCDSHRETLNAPPAPPKNDQDRDALYQSSDGVITYDEGRYQR